MPDTVPRPAYRGRFAPTPSGPLHIGSLATATASFLCARRAGGQWLVRMDDLDRPRCPPGCDSQILRQLEAHGLEWDEPVRYQATHLPDYREILGELRRRGLLYACSCTRADLKQASRAGPDGAVYAGTCRDGLAIRKRHSLRLRVPPQTLCFDDGWQGRQCRDLAAEVGDFVVCRADGMPAYQLACAVDEHSMCITEVVRGSDLLASSFRQIHILDLMGGSRPAYRHLPVVVNAAGRKLSKQNHAPAVDPARASANLLHCLSLLGQAPPAGLSGARAGDILQWGIAHWDDARLPPGLTTPLRAAGREVPHPI